MSTEILMPKLGFSMNEGIVSQWFAEDGTGVTKGQPLFTIESEKAVEEIEAPASGILRIIKECGMTYPVGTVLGEIV